MARPLPGPACPGSSRGKVVGEVVVHGVGEIGEAGAARGDERERRGNGFFGTPRGRHGKTVVEATEGSGELAVGRAVEVRVGEAVRKGGRGTCGDASGGGSTSPAASGGRCTGGKGGCWEAPGGRAGGEMGDGGGSGR